MYAVVDVDGLWIKVIGFGNDQPTDLSGEVDTATPFTPCALGVHELIASTPSTG